MPDVPNYEEEGSHLTPSNLEKAFDRVIQGMMVLGLSCALSIGLTFYLNTKRTDDINTSRYVNTFNACNDTNHRHDNAIAKLRLAANPDDIVDPVRKAEVQAGITRTITIIDALAPPHPEGCKAYTDKRVAK